jgi:hypothetical protein
MTFNSIEIATGDNVFFPGLLLIDIRHEIFQNVPGDLRVQGAFQLDANDVIPNFIALNPVVMGESGEGLLLQGPNSMVLIRGDADRLFVLKKSISFNQPVAARRVDVRYVLQKVVRTSPDQNPMGIALKVIFPDLKVQSIFHGNSGLAVIVDLVIYERAIAGKPKPEPVVGMTCPVAAVHIAFTEYSFEGVVWTIGSIIFFK